MLQVPDVIERIRGGVIVSCQALPDEPLYGSQFMSRMAVAAAEGGAVGIRANSPDDIACIKDAVDIPVIGINKRSVDGFVPYITPTLQDVAAVIDAGADIVAVDSTSLSHPEASDGAEFIRIIKEEFGAPIMADVSTASEGIAAVRAGADLVGTTLAGYVRCKQPPARPEYALIRRLVEVVSVPVLAEGRILAPRQAARAMRCGAWAVVVGAAITRPQVITQWYVEAVREVCG